MTKRVQIVRHDTAGADGFTGREGEVTVDTSRNDIRVHDGVTAGGHRVPTLAAAEALWDADDAAVLAAAQAYAVTQDANQIPDTIFSAANQLVYSTAVATEAALSVAVSTIVGRKATGNIAALSPAEARAVILNDPLSEIAALADTADRVVANDGAAMVYKAIGNASGNLVYQQDIYKHTFATGTKILAFQAAAPTGWTQDAAQNDKVLRVVSGAGGGTGGSWTISGISVDNHTLTATEMPAHYHTQRHARNAGGGVASPIDDSWAEGHTVGAGSNKQGFIGNTTLVYSVGSQPIVTSTSGSGGAHNHGLTIGSSWRPSYIDVIVITKDAP